MEYRRLGDERTRSLAAVPRHDDVRRPHRCAEAGRIVDDAYAAGVNFIDTADVYANGASEKIVGAAIGANRRRWILATKVGNPITKKPHDGGLSRRWMLAACDDSLARLATDYIDIYYLHKDDPDTPDRGDGRRRRRSHQERARSAISACRTIAAGASPKS